MNRFISKSRVTRGAALCVAALLAIFSFMAVRGEGLQLRNLALALFLSFLAGALLVLDFKIWRPASAVIYLLLPAAAVCCIEFYTHTPLDLTPPIFALNYLFYLCLFLAALFLTGSMAAGGVLAAAVPMLFGIVNYYVVEFRGSPIVPWDFLSFGTAVSVTDNYTITFTYRVVFVLTGFVFMMILSRKLRVCVRKLPVRLIGLAISIVLTCGYLNCVKSDWATDFFGLDTTLFTPNVLYRNNGIAGAFLSNLKYIDVEKPEGYSAEAAQEIADGAASDQEEGGTSESADTQGTSESADTPNILVIMNEAFSDLRVYGDFDTSEAFMPFIDSLKENTVRGSLYVSVKGGNTANTEFEFLTGNSMAFLPAGSVPYQQFIKGELPSLATHLADLGYTTAALHPYRAGGWNRNTVYQYLGFDSTCFQESFTGASTLRGYIDDQSAFNKLIQLYEEKEEGTPLFAFEVTMQNHGGYSKEYADLDADILLTAYEDESLQSTQVKATEKYLTLISKTDAAFENLVEYFQKQDEKTIIVMFGDHQPSDYVCNPILRLFGEDSESLEASADTMKDKYTVPFIIWANYDIQEEEVEAISADYLSALVMDVAGLDKTGYQEYLTELSARYPVITANFYAEYSEDGAIEFKEYPDEKDQALVDYQILAYNDLVDTKDRISGFFE